MTKKIRKDLSRRERLIDLSVDEISVVDKPAIGETFYLIKSLDGSNESMAKKNKDKENTVGKIVMKTAKWTTSLQKFVEEKHKAVDNSNTACKFCGITAEKEKDEIGAGLLCSCCINCAMERFDKGVFDACIMGTFDFDKYKEEHPEEFKETDKSEDNNDDSTEDNSTGNDTDGEDKEEDNKVTQECTCDHKKYEEDIANLKKNIDDLTTMLSQSLEFHGEAANFLNAILELNMNSLELATMMSEKNCSEETKAVIENLKTSITDFKKEENKEEKDAQKAGAKISTARLNALKEISDKLNELISSVTADVKKSDDEEEDNEDKTESQDEKIESLKQEFDNLRKSISEIDSNSEIEDLKEQLKSANDKMEELSNKLSDLEKSADASDGISDDDDEEEEDDDDENDGSVFKDFGPLKDVTSRIQKSTRTVVKKK